MNRKILLGLIGLLFSAALEAAQAPLPNSCVTCHAALDGKLQVTEEKFASDIHARRGFSCADCHGGDPASFDPKVSMSRAKGFRGAPRGSGIVALCGQCHSNAEFMKRFNPALRVDQVSEYYTSVHGKRLKQGDEKVATCVSCHSVHDIRSVSDPRSHVYPLNVADTCSRCHSDANLMKAYKIPSDQKGKYERSMHHAALTKQGDLSAPTCNDCHGNHGATPPGVGSVQRVCGQCHTIFEDLFTKSPHQKAFQSMNLPGCVYCHENHEVKKPSDAWVGTTGEALCVQCHASGDAGFQQAEKIRAGLEALKSSLEKSERVITQAEHAGMEVSQPKFDLVSARQSLTRARTAVHSFSFPAVDEYLKEGMKVSAQVLHKGEAALAEYQFRRKGLAVSLIFIALVIIGLYLKIREIDRRPSRSTDAH